MSDVLGGVLSGVLNDVVLQAFDLHKRFQEGTGSDALDVKVLSGVSLQVQRGQTLAITGASGSGKSTLLHLMGGLDAPTRGEVMLKGKTLSPNAVATYLENLKKSPFFAEPVFKNLGREAGPQGLYAWEMTVIFTNGRPASETAVAPAAKGPNAAGPRGKAPAAAGKPGV